MKHLEPGNIITALQLLAGYNLAFASSKGFRNMFSFEKRLDEMMSKVDLDNIKAQMGKKYTQPKTVAAADNLTKLADNLSKLVDELEIVKAPQDTAGGESILDSVVKPYFALFGVYAFSMIIILGFKGDWSFLPGIECINALLVVCFILAICHSQKWMVWSKFPDSSVKVVLGYLFIATILLTACRLYAQRFDWGFSMDEELCNMYTLLFCVFLALVPTFITFIYLLFQSLLVSKVEAAERLFYAALGKQATKDMKKFTTTTKEVKEESTNINVFKKPPQ